MYEYIYIYIYIYTCIYTYIYTHICIYICMCLYIYIYSYTRFSLWIHSTYHRKEHSKTEIERESSTKSTKNRRLFPGANLVLRPAWKRLHGTTQQLSTTVYQAERNRCDSTGNLWAFGVKAVPIRIPNRRQKQSFHCGIFCRISFIPNLFNRNRNRNSLVPVTFEFVTICDICEQNVTKSVFLKRLKNTRALTEETNSK